MSNTFTLFRTLAIYGICLPLAVYLGVLVANPDDRSNDAVVGAVLAVLAIPFVLRWHHAMLVLSWNMVAMMYFLPGTPSIFLPVCALSFFISVLQYILNRRLSFLSAPSLTWPLLAMAVVVLVTARLTGGIGIRIAGGTSYGGKRYIFMLAAIVGYFALTARRIPVERAGLYVKMYFLSALTALIGYLVSVVTPGMYFIFQMFPPDMLEVRSMSNQVAVGEGIQRVGALSGAGLTVFVVMLALYGVRGVFDIRKPWRLLIFLGFSIVALSGGFRSSLILMILVFGLQFYLEGLFRSRLFPAFVLGGVLCAALLAGFVDRLPLAMQRTFSFLPLEVDQRAEMDARGSTEWRLTMWQRVVADLPKYLLLGKGYSVDPREMEMITSPSMQLGVDPFEGSMIAGDYHSGPLSVIMTFGIWGSIVFLWFLYAGIKALYHNYLFGDPRLRRTNTLLFAYFSVKAVFFFLVFGSLYSDMAGFTGLLGLSVALNGGVRKPAPAPAVARQVFNRFKLVGAAR